MDTDSKSQRPEPSGPSSAPVGSDGRRTSAARTATVLLLAVLSLPVIWLALSVLAFAIVGRGGE
jgi:hypothetical protein